MWTHFWDMHSGGSQKEKFAHCYIEAPENEAKIIFYNRFGHNPDRVTCTCCGSDYSISEEKELSQLTAYQRGCRYGYFKNGKEISQDEGWQSGKGIKKGVIAKYVEEADNRFGKREHIPLDKYLHQKDVCVIYSKDIKESERIGELPEQGYIWHD